MYQEDSFFTLTMAGQTGLVILSAGLALSFFIAVWKTTANRRLSFRLLVGLISVALFEWLSPQLYYLYYIFLLDVPWQSVVGYPPTPVEMFKLLSFTDNANLSFHARGIFGWLLIIIAVFRK